MKFYLIAQLEIAYLKDASGDLVRKYFTPAGHFFMPGVWEFESFPKESQYYLKTMTMEEFRAVLDRLPERYD